MEVRTHKTIEAFIHDAASFITGLCHSQQQFSLALSGGQTPIPVYDAIATQSHFDPKCHARIFQVDERYVPPSHPASNQRIIIEHLIFPIQHHGNEDPIASASFFDTSLSLRKAAKQYARLLKNHITETGYSFDLCVLGIGTDGHVASLFPHSRALHSKKLATFTMDGPAEMPERLTITFNTIVQSKHILILLKGADKQPVLDELVHGSKTVAEFPAKGLLNHPHLTLLFGE